MFKFAVAISFSRRAMPCADVLNPFRVLKFKLRIKIPRRGYIRQRWASPIVMRHALLNVTH